MSSNKSVEPNPKTVARAERQRLAQEEGARAMADVARRAIEVRQNMQRLRALREAKDLREAKNLREAKETTGIKRSPPPSQAVTKKRQTRVVRQG